MGTPPAPNSTRTTITTPDVSYDSNGAISGGAHSLIVMAVQSGLTDSELHKRAAVPRPGAGIISDVDGRKNVWL